jgi:hypothetical protein
VVVEDGYSICLTDAAPSVAQYRNRMPVVLEDSRSTNGSRGRPATGQSSVVMVRMPEAIIAALDVWATQAGLSRSGAARRLIEAGLKRRPKPP